MRSFLGRDILSLKDMEREEFERIFEVAERLEPFARDRRKSDLLKDKTLVTAFYQPSTRTRLSHEAAMIRLGGSVLGFSDAKMTRAGDFYQESIKDTVKMLEFYGDVLVMRHFQKGAPHEAAKWASIPVVNGGDGWGEHPTQVLTDLYTLHRMVGRIDGLKFMCVGDARMRTMHSIGHALTQFDCEVTYVHPADMALDEEYKNDFRAKGLRFKEADHIDAAIGTADVIYIEPVVQADYTKSRVDSSDVKKGLTPENFQITRDVLAAKAKSDVIVLHSLPRMDELTPDVDETRHARYWQEAFYGVVMKMGMFALILGAAE